MLKCEVIGNIGADAEIKEFDGKKYVSFNVAHSEYRKDQSGNRVESTTWVSVLWYGDGGRLLLYLKKGVKVFVRGNEYVKTYNGRNGDVHAAINVSATEVQLCGVKGDAGSAQNGDNKPAAPEKGGAGDLPF